MSKSNVSLAVLTGLTLFREQLAGSLLSIRDDAGLIKGDEVVDDNVCDSVVWSARNIADAFNELAAAVGLPPVEVPAELEPSPYQTDDEEDEN